MTDPREAAARIANAPQPRTTTPAPSPLPSTVEKAGVRTQRLPGDADHEAEITISTIDDDEPLSITTTQAHALIDQLAWHVARPDVIDAHQRPPKRY